LVVRVAQLEGNFRRRGRETGPGDGQLVVPADVFLLSYSNAAKKKKKKKKKKISAWGKILLICVVSRQKCPKMTFGHFFSQMRKRVKLRARRSKWITGERIARWKCFFMCTRLVLLPTSFARARPSKKQQISGKKISVYLPWECNRPCWRRRRRRRWFSCPISSRSTWSPRRRIASKQSTPKRRWIISWWIA